MDSNKRQKSSDTGRNGRRKKNPKNNRQGDERTSENQTQEPQNSSSSKQSSIEHEKILYVQQKNQNPQFNPSKQLLKPQNIPDEPLKEKSKDDLTKSQQSEFPSLEENSSSLHKKEQISKHKQQKTLITNDSLHKNPPRDPDIKKSAPKISLQNPSNSLNYSQKKNKKQTPIHQNPIDNASKKESYPQKSTKCNIVQKLSVQPPTQFNQQLEVMKSQLDIPKRKNTKIGGTLGRKTDIDVNHLPMNLQKLFKKEVHHYDVQFNPDVPKKLLRTAFEEFNHKHYPNDLIAFDGRKNMYSIRKLPNVADVISVMNEENNRMIEFNISTSCVNVIQMIKIEEFLKNGSSNSPPQEALQVLDIVLKNRPFSLRFVNAGRSFFPLPRQIPTDLGEGMEMWKGFFQSPVIGWKPYLNIDVAHKGFPKYQKLTEYIYYDLKCNLNTEMDSRNLKNLASYVKGLKVDFLIPNQPNTRRSFKVNNLFDTAAKFFFEIEGPNGITQSLNVVQYFERVRNYKIIYPNLPCLHVGSPAKKTAIPIELCTVQRGQIRMKKLTEMQTSNMVKNAARPPSDRRNNIENSIKEINYNADPVLKEFGIEIQESFANIPARVLDQPVLSYQDQREIKPRLGVWRADKFLEAIKLSKWVVLNLDVRTNVQKIKDFERDLIRSGRDLNVNVSPMNPIYNMPVQRNWRLNEIEREIKKFFTSQKQINMELIVVIIPDSPLGIYATVKQQSELQVGVLTQCIKSKTMYKMNPATAGNILLKINSKLNGVNHTLAVRCCPKTMEGAIIFGADVTHPSPDQTAIPSVAAVAASHDVKAFQYNMEWRLQSPKVEIIQDLEDIIHIQLSKFREKTKSIPNKILFFRDGVSEGQFMQVLNDELMAIRRACMRLNPNYKPAITFVVVQKRHHTRFFPKNKLDMDGKFGNVPSGTIVDTHITHPTELDFYLCSHASIQGTSRPTKYHLLWDDNNLSEDQLEQLTFYLCFMFARCTRSVSYPAPTYYAHLAAFRARAYIENKRINLNRLDEEQANNMLNHSFCVNTPMFFV
ncbi:protein argonaute-2-like isoform X4 [Daktulosphaira vitifoliae]|uniref:protein argonaute-2-like isoform X3 n=1 Tax=Daktulosphaira vitifoliae TaxID=58002 RepID=UPI0021A9E112|nr:protein argonaute-2-like isoform X3 [Daktulosphaira vitifoliae]XP_050538342.1 protein argonaute-2-like isoform X4 [Daktulosphaira vitifoliae]